MQTGVAAWHRLLASERGSTLVSYSSLVLLVAIAAIALLGQGDAGGDRTPPAVRPASPLN